MVNKKKTKLDEDPGNARKKRRSIIQNRTPNIVSKNQDSKTSKPEVNASPSTSILHSPIYGRTPLSDIINTNGVTNYNLSPFNSPQSNFTKSKQFYQSPAYTVIPQPLKPFNPFDLQPTCLSSNNPPQSPFITPTANKQASFTYFTPQLNTNYLSPFVTQCTQPSTSNKPNQFTQCTQASTCNKPNQKTKTAISVQHLGINLMEKFTPTVVPVQSSQTTQSTSYSKQLPQDINDLSDEEHTNPSTESESDDSSSDNSSESENEWEIADENNQSHFTG
jgi:hypothetical protein